MTIVPYTVCVRGHIARGDGDPQVWGRSFTFDYPNMLETEAVQRAIQMARDRFDAVGAQGEIVIDAVYMST